MKKTVTYSVVGRVNPANRESGEVKYYAQSQARGEMGIREIAERIHQMCTVTPCRRDGGADGAGGHCVGRPCRAAKSCVWVNVARCS